MGAATHHADGAHGIPRHRLLVEPGLSVLGQPYSC
jgi:hypothetical protein